MNHVTLIEEVRILCNMEAAKRLQAYWDRIEYTDNLDINEMIKVVIDDKFGIKDSIGSSGS